MLDLEEYCERLRLGDLTVPPLQPWLLREGEKAWERALAATGGHPGRGELNDHLQLYASACCLQRWWKVVMGSNRGIERMRL